MDIVRVAYRDDDRTPVIYCIKEMGRRYYDVDVEVVHIKPVKDFEAGLFQVALEPLIDFVLIGRSNDELRTFHCL